MQGRGPILKPLLGISILLAGAALGIAFLLEKNGNHAIFKTGMSITMAMAVGTVLMIPGVALVLGSVPGLRPVLPDRPARPGLPTAAYWGLAVLSAAAVLFVVYSTFGMTLNFPVPKPSIAWDIARPMTDFFHEGEIVGSIGYITPDGLRELPMLIHGAGRNLLPAWLVSNFGSADAMIVQMRFVTSAGNFLVMLLAAACAMTATLILAKGQRLNTLGRAEAFAYSAFGVLVAATMTAHLSKVTNREIVLFAVMLVSLFLIWASASARWRLASGLAVLLGALAMLSPLHTYLGSIQSILIASAAAIIALVVSPGNRLRLFILGVLGAVATFATVSLLGGYWLFHDAVVAVLYWSENAGPIWYHFAPRPVLVGSLGLMCVGALLGGFSLSGKAVGMQDKAVRGVLALLVVSITVSTYSYANRSDINHFGWALYISGPAIAVAVTLLLLMLSKAHSLLAFVLAVLLAVPATLSLSKMGASGLLQSVSLLDTPDREILPEVFYEFTARFEEELQQQECLLVMPNDAAIAYLPRLPLCGTTFNPIHLNPEGDFDLARWLENNPQNLVVDGVEGHGAVGGPPMRARLPLTYAVIDRLYPRSERMGLWEIRLP